MKLTFKRKCGKQLTASLAPGKTAVSKCACSNAYQVERTELGTYIVKATQQRGNAVEVKNFPVDAKFLNGKNIISLSGITVNLNEPITYSQKLKGIIRDSTDEMPEMDFLNFALQSVLKVEDYEAAAVIRDIIKEKENDILNR